jgi:hypothetical protein
MTQKKMRGKDGNIAWVQQMFANPDPTNPTPSRAEYLELVKIRDKKTQERIIENENYEQ